MGDLYNRLKAIRESASAKNTARKVSVGEAAKPTPFAAVSAEAPQVLSDQSWRREADLVWSRTLYKTPDMETGAWVIVPPAGERVLWLDTETTGLSGGAGTRAFLTGWSSFSGGRFSVRQFFLQDFGGEPEYLELIATELREADLWVSYNGSSFDLPLLRTRFAMCGIPFPDVPHYDCLHPARRLWKEILGSCSLGRVERAVLGIERQGDLDGALVPEMYFRYLREGAGDDFPIRLSAIFNHHAQDVFSLAALHGLIAAIQREPLDPSWRREAIVPAKRGGVLTAFGERADSGDGLGIGDGPGFSEGPGISDGYGFDDGTGPGQPEKAAEHEIPILLEPVHRFPVRVSVSGLLRSTGGENALRLSLEAWLETRHVFWGLRHAGLCKKAARSLGKNPESAAARGALTEEAIAIWKELWEGEGCVEALVELLRQCERRGNLSADEGLRLLENALKRESISGALRDDLERRKPRLLRKAGRVSPR